MKSPTPTKAILIDKTDKAATPAMGFERDVQTTLIRDGRRTGRTPAPDVNGDPTASEETTVPQGEIGSSSETPAKTMVDSVQPSLMESSNPPTVGHDPATSSPAMDAAELTRRVENPMASHAGTDTSWADPSAETIKEGPAREQHTRVVKRKDNVFDEVDREITAVQRSKRRTQMLAAAVVAVIVGLVVYAVVHRPGPLPDPRTGLPVTAEAMTAAESAEAKRALEAAAQAETAKKTAEAEPKQDEAARNAEAKKTAQAEAAKKEADAKAAAKAEAEAKKKAEVKAAEKAEAEAKKKAEAERRAEAKAEAARIAEAQKQEAAKARLEAKPKKKLERHEKREKRTAAVSDPPPRETPKETEASKDASKTKTKKTKKSENLLFGGDDL
jgi:hypothetical protein